MIAVAAATVAVAIGVSGIALASITGSSFAQITGAAVAGVRYVPAHGMYIDSISGERHPAEPARILAWWNKGGDGAPVVRQNGLGDFFIQFPGSRILDENTLVEVTADPESLGRIAAANLTCGAPIATIVPINVNNFQGVNGPPKFITTVEVHLVCGRGEPVAFSLVVYK
jgi:hypothetical protein